MKALVIGATGYVGSNIALQLSEHGYETHGLARSDLGRARLAAAGVIPVAGDLNELDAVATIVRDFDVLVFAAMVSFEAEGEIIRRLLAEFSGPDRTLLFISGSGVVSTAARDGAWNDYTAAEGDPFPFPSLPTRQIRLATESMIQQAADTGLRSLIVRPPLIWGQGGSIQIPQIFESARRVGAACYLGQGLNLYSHAHVEDVARVSQLAIEHGAPGAIYHVVSGEVNFRSIAEAVGEVTECPTRSLDYDTACELWGTPWVDMGLAVNSRIRAPRTRDELGWVPTQVDLVEDIRHGSYRLAYEASRTQGGQPAYSWGGHG